MDKIGLIIELVIKLYGEEFFQWLDEQAKRTDTPIDDALVGVLRKWLMPQRRRR